LCSSSGSLYSSFVTLHWFAVAVALISLLQFSPAVFFVLFEREETFPSSRRPPSPPPLSPPLTLSSLFCFFFFCIHPATTAFSASAVRKTAATTFATNFHNRSGEYCCLRVCIPLPHSYRYTQAHTASSPRGSKTKRILRSVISPILVSLRNKFRLCASFFFPVLFQRFASLFYTPCAWRFSPSTTAFSFFFLSLSLCVGPPISHTQTAIERAR
jgi:hypothetical protein